LHRTAGGHRRINTIIYLDKEWRGEWGGNLELHKNPWNFESDEIISYPRCSITVFFLKQTNTLGMASSRFKCPRIMRFRASLLPLHVHQGSASRRDRTQARDEIRSARPSQTFRGRAYSYFRVMCNSWVERLQKNVENPAQHRSVA
jgi:hypothetical protein